MSGSYFTKQSYDLIIILKFVQLVQPAVLSHWHACKPHLNLGEKERGGCSLPGLTYILTSYGQCPCSAWWFPVSATLHSALR